MFSCAITVKKVLSMEDLSGQTQFEGAKLILGAGEQSESYDARSLISTLLIFVAKGDGSISNLESDKMIELLTSKFDTRSSDALERLSSAIMELANDVDIAQRLRKIGQGLSTDEKHEVFTMMLEVAGVDENLDPGEIEAIQFAGQILGMSQDAIHSKLRSFSSGR
jgi:uncharacterized tellurite resistance protein B-like protein